jgi:predicted RNase H-like HicB family nuclease
MNISEFVSKWRKVELTESSASQQHFLDLCERLRRRDRKCSTIEFSGGLKSMQDFRGLTGLVQREGTGYVALCPELDVASQGETVEEARRNLIEAVELFLETADRTEISLRLHKEVYVTPLEVSFG